MGWFTEKGVKTNKDLIEYFKRSYGPSFISSADRDDHIWVLYKDGGITSATCYLLDEDRYVDVDTSYKPIGIEAGPYKYDVPKVWINQITDVDERENGYKMTSLKSWLNSARASHNMKIKPYYYPELNKADTYTGKIKKLNHLIATDPHYGNDVWCRFEKKFVKPSDWEVKLIIKNQDYFEKYKNMSINMKGLDFSLLLRNPKVPDIDKILDINEKGTTYSKLFEKVETTIGMDTAQVAFGVNEYAKEISDYYKDYDNNSLDIDEYRPYFSIETLTDGVFGSVVEYRYKDIECGIKLDGWVDDDTGYDVERLLNYLEERLQIKGLTKVEEDNLEQEGGDLNYG